MSTLAGHSALQALHSRQRSMTSYSLRPVKSEVGTRPESTARSALARPRVECSSSFVAMYEGHIVPSVVLRQTPAPLHISTDAAKPPCFEKSSNVTGSHALQSGPNLGCSASGGLSRRLP